MQFSPRLYHWFVRPKWTTKKYIHDHIQSKFNFDNKIVLDFGSGTGANCCIFNPRHYLGIEPDSKRVDFARRLYPDHTFKVFENNLLPVENKTIDYILIIAVLHHISSDQIAEYLAEFHRVLRPNGKIIVIEPYLCEKHRFNNWFMNCYDSGEYIRSEDGYLNMFKDHQYECEVFNKFRKCFLYNELFFSAIPKPVHNTFK